MTKMNLNKTEAVDPVPPPVVADATTTTDLPGNNAIATSRAAKLRAAFGIRNIGAVYVLIAIIIVFSFWAPDTFPTIETVKSVLNQNAIPGLVALALVAPLSAQVFDLSIGNVTGLTNVIVAWLLVNHGFSLPLALILSVGVGLLVGLINAVVIVGFGIDSFIGTLATGALVAALTTMVSDNQAIIGSRLNGTFGDIAVTDVGGIALPVFLMIAVAATLYYILNFTVTGRRIYATGFNGPGAKLAGIKTNRLRFATLVVSGLVAGVAGVLLASQVSSGSPGIGQPYLLNAFAAAFLGATQFGGRFNAPGTVLAVLIIGTGDTGLVLVGAPVWAPDMFSGIVLLLALLVTGSQGLALLKDRFARSRRPAAARTS